MVRLQQTAEDAMAMGDLQGAALNIGKAALMASFLAKRQAQSQSLRHKYRGLAKLFRAQEQVYRALALFQQSGEHIPASASVCQTLSLGAQHAQTSQKVFSQLRRSDPSLSTQAAEWMTTIEELRQDFQCS
ncbi:MAG: hypothetical protein D6704_05220 [Nitrospirae bacterium]|nr:MAG: hypothetical protein D6704_05220 [Nitrospirota bacterium]